MEKNNYLEIERKFLVKEGAGSHFNDDPLVHDLHVVLIKQGYILNNQQFQARIRINNGKGFMTVKSGKAGLVRYEREIEIPFDMANILLSQCDGVIEKLRHYIEYKGHTFEVDVFRGNLEGLILAEIELHETDEEVDLPPFIQEEVTGNPDYYNNNLIKKVQDYGNR